jgi:hypothetical protein
MTIPEDTTRSTLEAGGLLSPDSCGWHYVEGLTEADDRRLAMLWCKEPLGHNGNRTKDGGREVIFVGGNIQWISGAGWPAFLDEQQRLFAERSPRAVAGLPLVAGMVELPGGVRIADLDCSCTVREVTKGTDFSSSGTSVGGINLVWYQAPVQEGYVTRTLSFSNLISAPVTINFTNGIPDATNFIFLMKEAH